MSKKFNIPVNDLYTFVKQEIGAAGMKKDGVHFPEDANEKLGSQVATKIIERLKL